jgi:excinuclease ABC subunit C
LKTVTGNDDFASMHEILSRRLRRGLTEDDLPDLIVVDGGKGQLAAAHAAMRDLGIEDVDMVGLAKSRDLKEPDSTARSPERIFLVGRKEPIVLPQNSAELFMLTRLRDEAHRFAITFGQKKLRQKTLASALEDIPSVGPARAKLLLKHFGSVKRIQAASMEEIAQVEGIGQSVAEKILEALHSRSTEKH